MHRLKQQNDSKLISFTCKVVMTNGLTRTLKLIEDMITYNETKNEISTGATLTWVLLINFPNNKIPGRQIISVRINDGPWSENTDYLVHSGRSGSIDILIEYTERTWADDIESMFSNYAKQNMNIITNPKDYPKGVVLLYVISPIFLSFATNVILITSNKSLLLNKLLLEWHASNEVLDKLNVLFELIRLSSLYYSPPEQPPSFTSIITIAAIFSITLIFYFSYSKASHIVLAEATKARRENRKNFEMFLKIGIGVAFVVGVVSSLVASGVLKFFGW
jgi:hypothetical protein